MLETDLGLLETKPELFIESNGFFRFKFCLRVRRPFSVQLPFAILTARLLKCSLCHFVLDIPAHSLIWLASDLVNFL